MTISQSDHCTFCGGTGQRNEHRYDKDHPHERLINEVYRYQAWLFQAWRTIRGQTKGLQRQRRLIKRVQADNAAYARRIMELEKQLGELTGNLETADKAVARNLILETELAALRELEAHPDVPRWMQDAINDALKEKP